MTGTGNSDKLLEKGIKVLVALICAVIVMFAVFWGIDRYRASQTTVESRIIASLEARVRKNPRDLQLRIVLGEAYLKEDRTGDAIEQFKQVIKVNPNSETAVLDLGLAYKKDGDWAKAEDQFKTIIAANELSPYSKMNQRLEAAYFYLATSQFTREEYKDALMNIKKALQIGKTNANSYLLEGRIYLEQKDYKAALTFFGRALKLDPKYADAYYGRALAREKLGKKKEARLDYERAIRMDHGFRLAKEGLRRVK